MKPALSENNFDFTDFLFATDWQDANITQMGVDTGLRQYFRLENDGQTAYLMDMSRGGLESGLGDYVRIDEYLLTLGMRVPQIYHYDLESGLAIIEDFGDQSFGDRLRAGDDKKMLYRKATEALLILRDKAVENTLDLVEFKNSIPRQKLNFFAQDYFPASRKKPFNQSDLDGFDKIFTDIMATAAPCPKIVAHADYHLENLMWNDALENDIGVIDFQDALWIQQPYDLVNLLEDARVTVDEEIKVEMKSLYCANMSAAERDAFDEWYAILSFFFHAKVIGQFTKYNIERGLSDYICHIPRLQKYILNDIQHPIMKPMKDFLEEKQVSFDISLDDLFQG